MYERFTDRARKVMQLANQEAQRFNHEYVGTEHILLGLIREGSGVAANALNKLGIDLNRIRQEVEKIVQSGPDMVTMGKLPQTPRAKKVIEYAIEEARQLNHNYVGTEHLLLGLVRENEGVAAQVLLNLGLSLDKVREQVLLLLGQSLGLVETGSEPRPLLVREQPGRNLTELARAGQLMPVTAWGDVIEGLIRILSCHTRGSALLLGPRGHCRTAVVEGLAQVLLSNDVPAWLKDKQIVDGGNNWRSHAWLRDTLQEAKKTGKVVLFLDDLPLNGEAAGALSLLTVALAQGELCLIVAATPEEYRRYVERDGTLERWLQPVAIRPPSRAETVAMLGGLRPVYEKHHAVRIQDDALLVAVELTERWVDGSLPDKALDVLDEAAALVRLRTQAQPPQVRDLEVQIEQLNAGKENAVAEQDFDRAAQLRDQADRLKKTRERLLREWRETVRPLESVGVETIAEVVKHRMGGKQAT
jgi:ATP-dependent Clp protease ATP-binding subunit ClpC